MKIADKDTKAVDLVRAALERAKECEEYHAFISMNEARAIERAREIDAKIEKGENVGRLAGVPFALKDNYLSPEGDTTAAAKMLEDFASPITATAVKKLEDEGAIMIGRANLDAYAHGGSTENSYFGPTSNAYDKTRVAGGSSGGSAVAVALDIVPFALGSDTGGSIRQPASFNGVYGVKPTFGAVSRYGVVAMASSTDTMGCFTKNATDADLIMSIIAGRDEKDSTTLNDFWTKDLAGCENQPRRKSALFPISWAKVSILTSRKSSMIMPQSSKKLATKSKNLVCQFLNMRLQFTTLFSLPRLLRTLAATTAFVMAIVPMILRASMTFIVNRAMRASCRKTSAAS